MESESEEEDKREMEDYGEHLRQNNLRLVTLAQCIAKNKELHRPACNELLNWCKDQRAFSLHFEKNLLDALQAAFTVCTQDGFDLQLVSDLINTCFHARRSLSKEGALRVSRWYEQLRRKRASRIAKFKRKVERERRIEEESNRINYEQSSGRSSSLLRSIGDNPSEEGLHPSSPLHSSMWNQTGAGLSTGAGPSSTPLSAVPMQSPAFANQFGHMSPSYNQQRMMMGAAPSMGGAPSSSVPPMQPGGMYPMMPFPSSMAGPSPVPVPPIPSVPSGPSKKGSSAAQTAAAQAAHQQQQLHMQMQLQMQRPFPLNIVPQGSCKLSVAQNGTPIFGYPQGFVAPNHPYYPHLYQQFQQHHNVMMMRQQQQQQAMAAAAAAASGGGGGATPAGGSLTAPSPQFGQQPAMNPQGVPIATQTAPGQMRPLNGYGNPSMGGGGGMMQPMMTPGGSSQSMPIPSPGGGGGGTGPQVQRVGTPVAFGQLQQQGMQHPVICVPNPMNPLISQPSTIIRITECLLGPLMMEHDSKAMSFPFNISDTLLNKVLNTPSLEVHIRSWSRTDNACKIFWHSNKDQGYACEIRVNGHPLSIAHPQRPIIVDKQLLRLDGNTMEIIEKSCVCGGSFGMSIVERMPIEEAVSRIFSLESNCDPANNLERHKAKMREFISRESPSGHIRLALFCNRSRQPIQIPARSKDCAHTSCFDLRSTLINSAENGIYECPVCSKTFQLEDVEIDHFVGQIIRETYQKRPPPFEVMLDQSCAWQMIPREESQQRFALSHPPSLPSYASPYGVPPLQQMQQMQHQSMSFPSSFPSMTMQQQQQMPLQQLQPQQMNGRKRESGGTENGGTSLKRFKSESFVTAPPTGRSPASMMAPHSVAPSMMMMGGPSTPMGGAMYGGPGSVPVMQHNHLTNMTSPYNMNTGVHPSPMKEPSSHHSVVTSSPMGSSMAPSTPYGSSNGMSGMNQTNALTCATDGGTHVQPTSSAPYTPGSVDNKSNGMTTVTASGVGPLSNPSMRAPSAALTPDTQASTSNASAEDDGGMRRNDCAGDYSLSNIEGLFLSREINLPEYLIIVGSIEVAKLTEEFSIYVRGFDSGCTPSNDATQKNDASWADAMSVCGGVPSSA